MGEISESTNVHGFCSISVNFVSGSHAWVESVTIFHGRFAADNQPTLRLLIVGGESALENRYLPSLALTILTNPNANWRLLIIGIQLVASNVSIPVWVMCHKLSDSPIQSSGLQKVIQKQVLKSFHIKYKRFSLHKQYLVSKLNMQHAFGSQNLNV